MFDSRAGGDNEAQVRSDQRHRLTEGHHWYGIQANWVTLRRVGVCVQRMSYAMLVTRH